MVLEWEFIITIDWFWEDTGEVLWGTIEDSWCKDEIIEIEGRSVEVGTCNEEVGRVWGETL